MPLKFNPSKKPLTVGMEIELQLINQENFDLSQKAPDVFAQIPSDIEDNVKPELMQSVIEVISGVNDSIESLENDMKGKLIQVLNIAESMNLSLVSAGTHPFSKWYDQIITDDPRYYRLMEQMQGIGRRLLTFGLHVHIGLDHAEKAIAIYNALFAYLPHFLSVSCSSPFWAQEKVGIHSARCKVFEGLPMAGLPLGLANWSDFVWLVDTLKNAEAIQSEKDIHWDLRPHPFYGTLELRICDAPGTLNEMLFIAALTQTVVANLSERYDEGERLPVPHSIIVRTNKWNTVRYGLECDFITTDGKNKPLIEDFNTILERLEPTAKKLGTTQYLKYFESILKNGTSSQQQLRVYEETQDLEKVVQHLNKQFKASILG